MAPWQFRPNRRPWCNDISALGMMTWQLSPNYRPMRFLHIIYRIQEMCYTDKSIVFPISFPCHIQSYLFPLRNNRNGQRHLFVDASAVRIL